MGESEFHFSPRPNRAHEIKWRGWSDEAFAEASKLDRPILLSISAVWCHWCHVMDETTYSNSGVIDLINREYVPMADHGVSHVVRRHPHRRHLSAC